MGANRPVALEIGSDNDRSSLSYVLVCQQFAFEDSFAENYHTSVTI